LSPSSYDVKEPGTFRGRSHLKHLQDNDYTGMVINNYMSCGVGKLTDNKYGPIHVTRADMKVEDVGRNLLAWKWQSPLCITFHFDDYKLIKFISINMLGRSFMSPYSSLITKSKIIVRVAYGKTKLR
jgi:hypothetical protein